MKKKIAIIGIVALLAMTTVTCDVLEGLLQEDDADLDKVIWTNVEYLDKGNQVKVWLDGSAPVPVTKRSLRAMSTDLSRMAYDYLEVIFISGTTIARSQWELGQSAGISGIVRAASATATAPDYVYGSGTGTALMAVGTKDNKTLLGIGDIKGVDGTYPVSAVIIHPGTQWVTFYLTSVKTGLIVTDESIGTAVTNNPVGALVDSFSGSSVLPASYRTSLGESMYPMYGFTAQEIEDETATRTYKFEGAPLIYGGDLISTGGPGSPITVERRVPRYLENGRYLIAKGLVNTRTRVSGALTGFDTVTLTFAPITGKGIFSFFIDIPVYLKVATPGTNGGEIKPIPWHIRTGFGSELYSLDDGGASGGCVLMGIGVTSLDWLDITWEWLP
jgi:hypothetical protein